VQQVIVNSTTIAGAVELLLLLQCAFELLRSVCPL
jgi:hypothetical protein